MSAAAEALVVGSGPNGLAAALTLARAGMTVEVREAAADAGGGCRSAELTLPGVVHDVCSAVHPLLAASPFFAASPPAGITLLRGEVAFAHPLDGARAAAVHGSVADTAAELGRDRSAYRRLMEPLEERWRGVVAGVLAPLLSPPPDPRAMLAFGLRGGWPASALAALFRGEEARALLAGLAAHSMRPLQAPLTGGYGLLLGTLAHAVGWPVVQGGSGEIARALRGELERRGGTVRTACPVADLGELPPARARLLDVTPRQLLSIAGDRLPARYARALRRYRYGPGVCKVDWTLSAPVPWAAAACARTATVHLGGSFEEIAAAEAQVWAGRHPERPFCIVVQPTLLDPERAPGGRQTLYAYCHVPAWSSFDMTARIEAQIERFAPGFGELVLARASATATQTAAAQPELPRWGHQRRRGDDAPAAVPPDRCAAPLPHAARGHLPVLVGDASGRRGARHVRAGGGARRAARPRRGVSPQRGGQGLGISTHGSRRHSA